MLQRRQIRSLKQVGRAWCPALPSEAHLAPGTMPGLLSCLTLGMAAASSLAGV